MRRHLLALAATTVGMLAIASGAYGASVKAEAPIQFENRFCGNNLELPAIGIAKYVRNTKTNVVTVNYKLTGGLPKTSYELTLWNTTGGVCEEIGPLVNKLTGAPLVLTTSKLGTGSKTGVIGVPPSDTEVFATGLGGGSYNDSLTVVLP